MITLIANREVEPSVFAASSQCFTGCNRRENMYPCFVPPFRPNKKRNRVRTTAAVRHATAHRLTVIVFSSLVPNHTLGKRVHTSVILTSVFSLAIFAVAFHSGINRIYSCRKLHLFLHLRLIIKNHSLSEVTGAFQNPQRSRLWH